MFGSSGAKAVLSYAEKKYGNSAEYLWEKFPSNAILRRRDNAKWYAAILTVKAEKLGLTDDCMLEVIDLRESRNSWRVSRTEKGFSPATT